METIGQRIRTLRRKRGLTQAKLAQLSGLASEHVCRLERDRRSPNLRTILALSAALECQAADLVGGA